MPASGAKRNAGTHATLANARQNGIVDAFDDSSDSLDSSRTRASTAGSASGFAIDPRASVSRYARSAAPRRAAAATRTGSAASPEPETSSRAAASTARAAARMPSAPSRLLTPNSFTSTSIRPPRSNGARGKN